MLKLDEFESVFKSAAKDRFELEAIEIRKVAVFTDFDDEAARLFCRDVQHFLAVLGADTEFVALPGGAYEDVGGLLDIVESERADLIVAFRNLHGRARRFPFSLGAHVDVLTQATTTPVLVVPPPTDELRLQPSCTSTDRVMVLTDHLTGSDHLVSYGAKLTTPQGHLFLTHLEDDVQFQRYIDVIGKVPSIDTDIAREDILAQLLKEPHDYIRSAAEELGRSGVSLEVHEIVELGHRTSDCRRLVDENAIDLVVLNTKDEDQLAMHGLAYPIAIDLRDVPLLLL